MISYIEYNTSWSEYSGAIWFSSRSPYCKPAPESRGFGSPGAKSRAQPPCKTSQEQNQGAFDKDPPLLRRPFLTKSSFETNCYATTGLELPQMFLRLRLLEFAVHRFGSFPKWRVICEVPQRYGSFYRLYTTSDLYLSPRDDGLRLQTGLCSGLHGFRVQNIPNHNVVATSKRAAWGEV